MTQGQADSSSYTGDFNQLMFVIQQAMNTLATSEEVQVVRAPYDRSGNAITPGSPVPIGFVDVKPLVNQVDGVGNATPHGTVYRLSYHRFQGGNGAFISDPVVGDQGKAVYSMRDTSVVKNTNAQGNPGSSRVYDRADGTYFGCTQGAAAPTQYLAWLAKGFNIKDAYGNTLQGTASGVLINGCLINQNGDVISKRGTDLDTHVHTEVTTGTADTGPPA